MLTGPELEHLALFYAERDTPIATSMEIEEYVRWFTVGYTTRLRMRAFE